MNLIVLFVLCFCLLIHCFLFSLCHNSRFLNLLTPVPGLVVECWISAQREGEDRGSWIVATLNCCTRCGSCKRIASFRLEDTFKEIGSLFFCCSFAVRLMIRQYACFLCRWKMKRRSQYWLLIAGGGCQC